MAAMTSFAVVLIGLIQALPESNAADPVNVEAPAKGSSSNPDAVNATVSATSLSQILARSDSPVTNRGAAALSRLAKKLDLGTGSNQNGTNSKPGVASASPTTTEESSNGSEEPKTPAIKDSSANPKAENSEDPLADFLENSGDAVASSPNVTKTQSTEMGVGTTPGTLVASAGASPSANLTAENSTKSSPPKNTTVGSPPGENIPTDPAKVATKTPRDGSGSKTTGSLVAGDAPRNSSNSAISQGRDTSAGLHNETVGQDSSNYTKSNSNTSDKISGAELDADDVSASAPNASEDKTVTSDRTNGSINTGVLATGKASAVTVEETTVAVASRNESDLNTTETTTKDTQIAKASASSAAATTSEESATTPAATTTSESSTTPAATTPKESTTTAAESTTEESATPPAATTTSESPTTPTATTKEPAATTDPATTPNATTTAGTTNAPSSTPTLRPTPSPTSASPTASPSLKATVRPTQNPTTASPTANPTRGVQSSSSTSNSNTATSSTTGSSSAAGGSGSSDTPAIVLDNELGDGSQAIRGNVMNTPSDIGVTIPKNTKWTPVRNAAKRSAKFKSMFAMVVFMACIVGTCVYFYYQQRTFSAYETEGPSLPEREMYNRAKSGRRRKTRAKDK